MGFVWIVPVLFSIALTAHAFVRFHKLKNDGTATAAEALRAGLKPDELAQAAVLFFLLWRTCSLILLFAFMWALLFPPLHCGI